MSHNRFNTTNIMTLAALSVVTNPLTAEQLKKAEQQQRVDTAKIHEQNKQALQKVFSQAPKQQPKQEAKQTAHNIHQPRGPRR